VARCSIITKVFFFVALMAVEDTTYRFVFVNVDRYGKDCDSTIFKRSTLWTSIQTIMLKLPSERPLSGTEDPHVEYHTSLYAMWDLH